MICSGLTYNQAKRSAKRTLKSYLKSLKLLGREDEAWTVVIFRGSRSLVVAWCTYVRDY